MTTSDPERTVQGLMADIADKAKAARQAPTPASEGGGEAQLRAEDVLVASSFLHIGPERLRPVAARALAALSEAAGGGGWAVDEDGHLWALGTFDGRRCLSPLPCPPSPEEAPTDG